MIVDKSRLCVQVVVDWLERISCTSLEDFPAKVKYFADSVSW